MAERKILELPRIMDAEVKWQLTLFKHAVKDGSPKSLLVEYGKRIMKDIDASWIEQYMHRQNLQRIADGQTPNDTLEMQQVRAFEWATYIFTRYGVWQKEEFDGSTDVPLLTA